MSQASRTQEAAPVGLRCARPEDAAQMAEIHRAARARALPWLRAVLSERETLAYLRRRLEQPGFEIHVAERDGCVLGYITLWQEYVDALYVRPSCQRQGIATRLMDFAKAARPGGLRLRVFERNTGSRAFYEACGFRAVPGSEGVLNQAGELDLEYAWTP